MISELDNQRIEPICLNSKGGRGGARDWKGLDNYGSNAVIVRRNKNEQPSTSNLHRGG